MSVPTNDTAPVVVSTLSAGDLAFSSNGIWTGADSLAFQWFRANNGAGSGSTAISGQTEVYKSVIMADYGKFLKCVVTPTNGDGAGTATSSNWLEVAQQALAGGVSLTRVVTAVSSRFSPNSNPINLQRRIYQ